MRRVAPIVAVCLVACSGAKAAREDRDRGLADSPLRLGVDHEALAGDLGVGVAAVRDDDCDTAIPALQSHLAKNKRSALAHYHIGLCHLQAGKNKDARIAFEKAWDLNPQLHGAASNLGALYLMAGEEVAALRALEIAADMAPEDGRVLANLGAARLRRGLWTEAVDAYVRAEEAAPGVGSIYYGHAVALMERYEYGLALEVVDKAIAARPKYAVALAARVVCLQELGRVTEAQTEAQKALNELGGSPAPDLQIALARTFVAQGNVDEARKILAEAIDAAPDHALVQLATGELADAAGNKPEAAQWYARFLANPARPSGETRRIRERLKQLAGR
jgi:tetratricopeptide (TPR) repeat protein